MNKLQQHTVMLPKPIRGVVVNRKQITIRCVAPQNAGADDLLAIFVEKLA